VTRGMKPSQTGRESAAPYAAHGGRAPHREVRGEEGAEGSAEGVAEGVGHTVAQSPEAAMRGAVRAALDAGNDALAAERPGMLRARAARGRGG
jgi:hypothetical protein